MATLRSDLSDAFVRGQITSALITAVRDESVTDTIATPHVTDAKALTFPKVTRDLVAVNIAEGAAIDLSDIGTGEVTVTPRKQVAATRVSNETLADVLHETNDSALSLLTGSLQAALATTIDQNTVDALDALAGATDGGSADLTTWTRGTAPSPRSSAQAPRPPHSWSPPAPRFACPRCASPVRSTPADRCCSPRPRTPPSWPWPASRSSFLGR